jgi:hypothetical protein
MGRKSRPGSSLLLPPFPSTNIASQISYPQNAFVVENNIPLNTNDNNKNATTAINNTNVHQIGNHGSSLVRPLSARPSMLIPIPSTFFPTLQHTTTNASNQLRLSNMTPNDVLLGSDDEGGSGDINMKQQQQPRGGGGGGGGGGGTLITTATAIGEGGWRGMMTRASNAPRGKGKVKSTTNGPHTHPSTTNNNTKINIITSPSILLFPFGDPNLLGELPSEADLIKFDFLKELDDIHNNNNNNNNIATKQAALAPIRQGAGPLTNHSRSHKKRQSDLDWEPGHQGGKRTRGTGSGTRRAKRYKPSLSKYTGEEEDAKKDAEDEEEIDEGADLEEESTNNSYDEDEGGSDEYSPDTVVAMKRGGLGREFFELKGKMTSRGGARGASPSPPKNKRIRQSANCQQHMDSVSTTSTDNPGNTAPRKHATHHHRQPTILNKKQQQIAIPLLPKLNDHISNGEKEPLSYRGVSRHRLTQRWESSLWLDNRQLYLGGFDNSLDAAKAYDLAALACKGKSAIINFDPLDYSEQLREIQGLSKEEVVAYVRRHSSAFARGKSRYRGVSGKDSRWEARIGSFGGKKNVSFGVFENEEGAARQYDRALILEKGRAAKTNFPLRDYVGEVAAYVQCMREYMRDTTVRDFDGNLKRNAEMYTLPVGKEVTSDEKRRGAVIYAAQMLKKLQPVGGR